MKTLTKTEINKTIALFTYIGGSTKYEQFSMMQESLAEELKFTDSWDWLLPVYQHLVKITELLKPDGILYIEHCTNKYLDFDTMNTMEFAEGLVKIIEEFNFHYLKR